MKHTAAGCIGYFQSINIDRFLGEFTAAFTPFAPRDDVVALADLDVYLHDRAGVRRGRDHLSGGLAHQLTSVIEKCCKT